MLQLTSSTVSTESAVQTAANMASIAERIRGEFREMPGLTLTVAQAQRLWNVDLSTCTEVLTQLLDAGFLCRRADGAYGRASDLTARPLRSPKAGIQFLEADRPRRAAAIDG
jgi:Fic family protein